MKRCKVCRKKPGIEMRVNCEGVVFCSDNCYDEYDQSPNDHFHPYIDDYDAVRFEYIEWQKSYENDLYNNWLKGNSKKDELAESIDDLIDEFFDYYQLEGTDGIFSAEIYRYLLEFEDLKEKIIKWQPDLKELENY